jgi:hypothetical protein
MTNAVEAVEKFIVLTESGRMLTKRSVSDLSENFRKKYLLKEVDIIGSKEWNSPKMLAEELKKDPSVTIVTIDKSGHKVRIISGLFVRLFMRESGKSKNMTSYEIINRL